MNRTRETKKHIMRFNGTAEEVFALLCPTHEFKWMPNWNCEMVYSDSGMAELDCIFKTSLPDKSEEEIWIMSKYKFPNHMEIIRVNKFLCVRYIVDIKQHNTNEVIMQWQQIITGLNKEGDDFIIDYIKYEYQNGMNKLEKKINHFLTTGQIL